MGGELNYDLLWPVFELISATFGRNLICLRTIGPMDLQVFEVFGKIKVFDDRKSITSQLPQLMQRDRSLFTLLGGNLNIRDLRGQQ